MTVLAVLMLPVAAVLAQEQGPSGDAALGTHSYDDYDSPDNCGPMCHNNIYQQWRRAMMSQSYTHHWDEIEYFVLALPHAEKVEKVSGVKTGCNGCHAPLAFFAGDIPPKRPAEGTRANEGVSCEICHTAIGFEGDTPYNFNFISSPGEIKYGPRKGDLSPAHSMTKSDFHGSAEFCGTCHNEQSPFGAWVKATHLEWKEGPYAAEGVICQDCHMTYAPGTSAEGGTEYADVRQHTFHGAHNADKLRGAVELGVYPDENEVKAGGTVTFTVTLFNQKPGHKFPTGSVEDRILWLHVEARDAAGKVYHLPVDPKGFEGEGYTIAADVKAYQDMAVPLDKPDFEGVARDGIPVGDRIFRMAYLDPEGRMTIQQWNTASFGPDYRFAPRETKLEHFTFKVPEDAAPGTLTVTAVLNYQKLVKPVADFLNVPDDEAAIVVVNDETATVAIKP